jgi:regulator of protease activity HflC (stomatin/prohibitin superfamily)
MKTILERLTGRVRVLVKENERALHLHKGELRGILTPGEHLLSDRKNRLEVERHNLAHPELVSPYEKALFDKLPRVASEHLTVVQTAPSEVAVVERDNRVHTLVAPDTRIVLWTAAGPWTVTRVDTAEVSEIAPALLRRLGQARTAGGVTVIVVPDEQAALMFVDGVLTRTLKPGIHGFWTPGRMVQHKLVDLKRQTLEVAGQELLTRDRVTIRVNLSAGYRVTDPVKAVTSVKDFAEALYRALQVAFRKTLGAMTLDQILENKGAVDDEAAGKVRAEMAAIGLEVSDITLKDVILPGEMRDILNKVVAASKEAEANVIRRREETNATRSLLNTAKVMAENPVMLRLKELEALEAIAGKVERLTVLNGTGGLMNDLVRLRADTE